MFPTLTLLEGDFLREEGMLDHPEGTEVGHRGVGEHPVTERDHEDDQQHQRNGQRQKEGDHDVAAHHEDHEIVGSLVGVDEARLVRN